MSGNAVDNDQKRRIAHVVNYISEHLDDQVSLETLAGVAHYSPFHLQKVFKQIVGDSPKQYMMKLRLETAFTYWSSILKNRFNRFRSKAVFPRPQYFRGRSGAISGIHPNKFEICPTVQR